MKRVKSYMAMLSATALLAGLMATSAGVAMADGSLVWNGINGSTACLPGTTGTVLWIFNPHSDAVPTGLTINGDPATGTGWTQAGGSQNWHFTADILGTFADITSASLTYTGDLGKHPVFTISGCNEGNERPPADDLMIVKTAAGTYDTEFGWTIAKDVDKNSAEVPLGGSATFTYTVTVTHDAGSILNVHVAGSIDVLNPNAAPVTIDSLTDELSDGTDCSGSITPSSTVMAPGNNHFTYSCDLPDGSVPLGLVNTATVAWSEQILSNGSLLAAGSTFFDADVAFTGTDIDNCVQVDDTFAGDLGYHCVGDAADVNGTFTFTYQRRIGATTLGECLDYDNTASFEDNSTPVHDGDDSQTVTVCTFNAPLTPGYWKTHLTFDSRHPTAAYTSEYLPILLGAYSVSTTAKATAVWDKMNCSKSGDNNAVGCLAGHLLAAKLNVANGSNTCISSTIAAADAFLVSIGYTGPSGSYSLNATQRANAISLKSALDKYNNGGGC